MDSCIPLMRLQEFHICEFDHCICKFHGNHLPAQACLTLVVVQSRIALSVQGFCTQSLCLGARCET
jgi:hypothetical protein